MCTGKLFGQPFLPTWKNAEITCDGLASHSGGVAILLVASAETGISSDGVGHFGSRADFTFLPFNFARHWR